MLDGISPDGQEIDLARDMTLTGQSHSVKQSSALQQLVSGRRSGPGTVDKT